MTTGGDLELMGGWVSVSAIGGCLCATVCGEAELRVEVTVSKLRLALRRARLAENFAVRRGIFDAQPPLAETETQPPISSIATDLATESG